MLISYRLLRKIAGATLGAVAVATVFSLIGYSEERNRVETLGKILI